jgi:ATP-dependent protease ClpP protease subunit
MSNIGGIKLAPAALILVIAWSFDLSIAKAQFNARRCASLIDEATQAMYEHAYKREIALARQYLTSCVQQSSDYAFGLASLASALNRDNQHEEALAVANRCLQTNDAGAQFSCSYDRTLALFGLGRVREAKSTLQTALKEPTFTENDAAIKKTLQQFLADVNEHLRLRAERQAAGPVRPAHRGSAKVTEDISCSGVVMGIDIDGDIDASTVEKVRKAFYSERSSKCETDFALFADSSYKINSSGGSIAAAMAIGRIYRKERVSLAVNGVCISACVLILAGAVERGIGEGRVVGIHRPYLGTTPERTPTPDQISNTYRSVLQNMRAYLREMNVSERLADEMLATEPDKVRFLIPSELKAYGLWATDPVEQEKRAIENETRDVQEANKLGLDRREYIRRKVLGEHLCPDSEPEFWQCRRRVLQTGGR